MSVWPMVTLGDIISASGRRAGADTSAPVYSVTKHSGFVPSLDYFKKQVFSRDVSKYKVVEKGEFAYATIHLDEGSIGIAPQRALISPMYTIFHADTERVVPEYLLTYLKSDRALAFYDVIGQGAVHRRKSISLGSLAAFQVPLPPLAEQRRIAAILDQVQGLQRRAKHQLNLLLSIESSLFDRTHLNLDSSMQTLGELGWDFTSGKNIVSTDGSSHPTNRVIKVSAASSGTFLPAESKPLPISYNPPESHRISEGDILFCRASGSLDLIGRTAKVDAATDLFLPDKVWRLRLPVDGTPTRYALGVLRSRRFLDFVQNNASGAAGVKNISKKKVLSYPTTLPGIATQDSFATEAQALDVRVEVAKARCRRLNELASSLSSRAFRGEL